MATNNFQEVKVVVCNRFSQVNKFRIERSPRNINELINSDSHYSSSPIGLCDYTSNAKEMVKFLFSSTCREVLSSEIGPLFRSIYELRPNVLGQCAMKISLSGPDYEYAISLAKNEQDANALLDKLTPTILRVSKLRLVGISVEETIKKTSSLVLYALPSTHPSIQIGLWILMHTFKEKRLLDLHRKTDGVLTSTHDYLLEIISISFDRFKGVDTSYTNRGMAKSESIKEYLKEPQNDTGSDYFSMFSLAVWCVADVIVGSVTTSKAPGPISGILSIEFPTLLDSMIYLVKLLDHEQKSLLESLINKSTPDIYGGKKHPIVVAYKYANESE